MNLLDWINNPWVIGIAASSLSGIVVTYIGSYLFSRRDSREYAQRVSAVNREVVSSIRIGVSEGIMPDVRVLNALIVATCRKYSVDLIHVLDAKGITQELVKEVIDSSFISAQKKEELCGELVKLMIPPAAPPLKTEVSVKSSLARPQKFTYIAISLLSGLATAIAVATMLFSDDKLAGHAGKTAASSGLTMAVATVVATVTIASFITSLINARMRRMRRMKSSKHREQAPPDNNKEEKE